MIPASHLVEDNTALHASTSGVNKSVPQIWAACALWCQALLLQHCVSPLSPPGQRGVGAQGSILQGLYQGSLGAAETRVLCTAH